MLEVGPRLVREYRFASLLGTCRQASAGGAQNGKGALVSEAYVIVRSSNESELEFVDLDLDVLVIGELAASAGVRTCLDAAYHDDGVFFSPRVAPHHRHHHRPTTTCPRPRPRLITVPTRYHLPFAIPPSIDSTPANDASPTTVGCRAFHHLTRPQKQWIQSQRLRTVSPPLIVQSPLRRPSDTTTHPTTKSSHRSRE